MDDLPKIKPIAWEIESGTPEFVLLARGKAHYEVLESHYSEKDGIRLRGLSSWSKNLFTNGEKVDYFSFFTSSTNNKVRFKTQKQALEAVKKYRRLLAEKIAREKAVKEAAEREFNAAMQAAFDAVCTLWRNVWNKETPADFGRAIQSYDGPFGFAPGLLFRAFHSKPQDLSESDVDSVLRKVWKADIALLEKKVAKILNFRKKEGVWVRHTH